MDRRNFLKTIPLAAGIPAFAGFPSFKSILFEDDALLCSKKFELAASLNLRKKPIGEVVIEMGKSFLGTEYVANTLEQPGEEHLVVNLHGLDCVSFYENALVFARCIKKNKTTFDDYKKELQFIRYRGGIISGYTSRLHYTSDYFFDNEKKRVLEITLDEFPDSQGVITESKIDRDAELHVDGDPERTEEGEELGPLELEGKGRHVVGDEHCVLAHKQTKDLFRVLEDREGPGFFLLALACRLLHDVGGNS